MEPGERQAVLTSLCALPAPDPDDLADRLRAVGDWPSLTRHILAHCIQGITYPRLRAGALKEVVPGHVVDSLRETVRATAAQNLFHQRALQMILDALAGRTPVLLAKGISLIRFAYERPSMRPMTDIDFYIRPEDVDLFERAVEDLGFTPEERRRRPRQWWIENFQHLEPYVSPDGRVRVEPHLRNAGAAMPYRTDMEPVWRRARVVDQGGRAVHVMAPDDELAHLILHLYVHDVHLVKLLGLVDLDRTARAAGGLDWDRLVGTGREQGYDRLLYLPLRLAADLLGTPAPASTLADCRPEDLGESDVEFLASYVFRDDVEREQIPFRVTEALAARGARERLRLAARTLAPPGREIAERYNLPDGSPRVPLFRLLHPFLAGGKWARFLMRMVRGDARQRRLMRLTALVSGWARREKR